MQVILLERIGRLGQMGDVVNVKNGYARNFLLPQKKALRATRGEPRALQKDRAPARGARPRAEEGSRGRCRQARGKTFLAIRQAGDTGQLYGSVTPRDIAEVVTAGGFSVDRRQVILDKPIKTLGVHATRIALHPEVIVQVSLNVARSEDEAERQARGEDVLWSRRRRSQLETFNPDAVFEEEALAAAQKEGADEAAPRPDPHAQRR